MKSTITELFPHSSFREKQYEVIQACLQALYEDGYDNVVLQAPTGTGKSSINTTLLRHAEDGFYSSPQKSLREQIQADSDIGSHISSLKARKDYFCQVGNDNCEDCYVNQDSEQSCSEFGGQCSYWGAKMNAINSEIANITFSYLIIDNMLPSKVNETPVSFEDREMLVVDEAHGLIQQTEEMHAGFDVTPYGLPRSVFMGATDGADLEASSYEDVSEQIGIIYARAKDYPRDDVPVFQMEPAEKQCKRMVDKIEWMKEQVDAGYPWVVDVDTEKYGNNYVKTLSLTPTNVASYLKNNVWSRAKKRIVSTATLPYQNNPEIWLRKVGLDPKKTKVINVGMTFPVENRPIYTDSVVCSMSGGGDKDNWSDIMDKLNELAEVNYNKKGLVHTASYGRATRILDSINPDDHPYLDNNVYVHNQEKEAEDEINDWQDSDKDIFLSPSVMEGIDLRDESCRWQVLLKVPYPPQSSRIQHMLNNEEYGWSEYKERTLLRVVQSYGRAVRSKDDWADMFILDEDFNKLISERTPPKWFSEAVTDKKPEEKSVFNY